MTTESYASFLIMWHCLFCIRNRDYHLALGLCPLAPGPGPWFPALPLGSALSWALGFRFPCVLGPRPCALFSRVAFGLGSALGFGLPFPVGPGP